MTEQEFYEWAFYSLGLVSNDAGMIRRVLIDEAIAQGADLPPELIDMYAPEEAA